MSEFADFVESENENLRGGFSSQSYSWAWSTLNTRSIYMEQKTNPLLDSSKPDNCVLAPFLDMFNHSDSAKVCIVVAF